MTWLFSFTQIIPMQQHDRYRAKDVPDGMSLQGAVFKTDRARVVEYPYYICDSKEADSESQRFNFDGWMKYHAVITLEQQRDDQNKGEGISSSLWDGDLNPGEDQVEEQIQADGRSEAQVPNPLEGVDQHERREQEHPEHVEQLSNECKRCMIERTADADDQTRNPDDDRINLWKTTRLPAADHHDHAAEYKRQ